MSNTRFTVDDLKRILSEGSGEPEGVGLREDTVDTEFTEIGYDSLALLETNSRIEREYGLRLDEELLETTTTPRALIRLVNDQLTSA
ncbi:acyl carrier protein [Actinokineospora diospyrosa]|uniref:Act minimal PKS acyl carrier protein n=1 Tax=Actinokineospora diospyrosa TaxID=103728 RepID=A0ABT1IDX9_9PSEU|nr:phosphopantetheine-binding protein [Actinokineospora diospyrosa]MCP2270818.1 act minimal PKS acyl carrier protein [Actinokineospora diospyrosa]